MLDGASVIAAVEFRNFGHLELWWWWHRVELLRVWLHLVDRLAFSRIPN